MRSIELIILGGVLMLTSSCESPSYTGSGLFRSAQPQIRTISAEYKTTYQATQRALKRMDFVLTKSRLSRGQVVGISRLRDTVVFGAARQFEFKIKISDLGEGQTQIAVRLFEQSEADFSGSATNRALSQHGLYDSFFANLEELLKEHPEDMGTDEG